MAKNTCWKRVLSFAKQIYRGRCEFYAILEISTVVEMFGKGQESGLKARASELFLYVNKTHLVIINS